jgi:hypothetical protein
MVRRAASTTRPARQASGYFSPRREPSTWTNTNLELLNGHHAGTNLSGSPPGNLLSGEDIQRLLLSPTARRMLRDQLRALLAPRAVLERCDLNDAIFRPGLKLTAYLDVLVRLGAAGGYCVRPVTVTWESNTDEDRHETVNQMHAEALRRDLATPFLQLMADAAGRGMRIRVWPLDARFTKLVRLSDPRYLRAMLADACKSGNSGSARRRVSECTVTPVRYRPGKRHVLRYDLVGGQKGEAVFAKLYTGVKGAQAFRVANRTADWLAERGEGVNSLRPLAYMVEDAVVLYPRIFGAPLSDHLRRPSDGLARWLERTGAALHTLHRLPGTVAGPLEVRTFATEIQEIERVISHIPTLLPRLGAAVEALLDRAQELHDRLPQEAPAFTHRDFKSAHVWVTPDEITLMDFDRSRLADPALDVGTFLADLHWWYANYNLRGLVQAQERFLAGYVPGAPIERLVRARLYEAIKLVKMTVLRVHLFEQDWASRTAGLVEGARSVMDDLQRILGLTGAGLPATRFLVRPQF